MTVWRQRALELWQLARIATDRFALLVRHRRRLLVAEQIKIVGESERIVTKIQRGRARVSRTDAGLICRYISAHVETLQQGLWQLQLLLNLRLDLF